MNFIKIKSILTILLIFSLINCSGKKDKIKQHNTEKPKPATDRVKIISPKANSSFRIGEEIEFEIQSTGNSHFDSIIYKINNTEKVRIASELGIIKDSMVLPVENTGKVLVKIRSFLNDSVIETDYIELVALSDIEPEKYTYKILNTFPHQTNSYTQGFVYRDGFIYEGTGSWGQSRLMKYALGSLMPVMEFNNDANIFGEGIEVFDNQIVQLTYMAQKGYIYNLENFEKIREVKYPYREGWGITYDGKNLIMSDGTNVLYFLDKKLFTEVHRIEVCDNNEVIDSINEMEYVDNNIYANIYLKNYILCIDPKTGKVLKHIDMSDLLSQTDRQANTDVLNGIAYNKDKGTYFVTGKNWPKIFEVVFVKK